MQQVAKVLGGTAAIGGGVYVAVGYATYYRIESESSRLQQKVNDEAAAKQSIQSSIREQEGTVSSLAEAQAKLEQGVAETESKLAAAREEVARLEAARDASAQERLAVADKITSARDRIAALKGDYLRRHSAFTEAERAAAAARSRAEKARAEANPLNHPLVKEYFKRS